MLEGGGRGRAGSDPDPGTGAGPPGLPPALGWIETSVPFCGMGADICWGALIFKRSRLLLPLRSDNILRSSGMTAAAQDCDAGGGTGRAGTSAESNLLLQCFQSIGILVLDGQNHMSMAMRLVAFEKADRAS